MKSLSAFVLFFFLAASACAQDPATDGRDDAFEACLRGMKDIFTQSQTMAGQNGVTVICTIMPTEEIVSIGWKILNPNGALITVQQGDVRLYSGGAQFERLPTDQAIEVMDTWPNQENTANPSRALYEELRERPGEESREDLMNESAFVFGSSSDDSISGMTYFSCRLKDQQRVTAEIRISGEAFAFAFDGVGP